MSDTEEVRGPRPVVRGDIAEPSSATPIRIAPLAGGNRPRLVEILRAARVFRPDEVDVALELFDETYGAARGTGDAGRRADVGESPESPILDPAYRFLGAFDGDGVLLGYACYGPTPGTDRTYDLYWIAVHPSAQGTGAGTRLLEDVERRIQDEQARLLVVETSSRDDYEATRGFYRARGYAVAAELGNFYAPGDDRVIFTKRFHSPDGRGAAAR